MFDNIHHYRIRLLICSLLVFITAIVYFQVKNHPFINLDDDVYVTDNDHVQKGLKTDSIKWAFATTHGSEYWHPLTWLSHMLDVQLFGLKAGWHHLVNVLFHILNTVLLFLIFNRMTHALWPSAFVAALFALHPLHVESVAWVAERKDVLSTFFWMLTMGAYVFYVEKPDTKKYLLTLCLFALGLMAKPMVVTLPFVLLLLDYWPLKRFQTRSPVNENYKFKRAATPEKLKKKKQKGKATGQKQADKLITVAHVLFIGGNAWSIIKEKIPFFALAFLSSAITLISIKKSGTMADLHGLPMTVRAANASISYVRYLIKTVWPQDLAIFYPPLFEMPPFSQIAGSISLLAIITLLAICTIRTYPYLVVGWLWFFGILFPVIGFIRAGGQESMADRFTYIPSIGLFIIIAWAIDDLTKKWSKRKYPLLVTGVLLFILLSISTWKQIGYWKSDLSLFQHSLAIAKENPRAITHAKIGVAFQKMGRLDEARLHFETALRINPAEEGVHNQLGILSAAQGKMDEAILFFNKALTIKPNNVIAHNNLGIAFLLKGNLDQSLSHFRASLQIKPEDPEIHFMTGKALTGKGDFDNAIFHFKEVLRLQTNNAVAHNDLGVALVRKGDVEKALFHFREALRLKPGFKAAQNNLDIALKQKRKVR